MRTRIAILLFVSVVAGCANQAAVPTTLQIATRPVLSPAPGQAEACPQALFGPVILGRQGDTLTFTSADTSQELELVWPHGFSARLVDGKAELLDSSGAVVGREGDTLSNLGGGGNAVCSINNHMYSDQVSGFANP